MGRRLERVPLLDRKLGKAALEVAPVDGETQQHALGEVQALTRGPHRWVPSAQSLLGGVPQLSQRAESEAPQLSALSCQCGEVVVDALEQERLAGAVEPAGCRDALGVAHQDQQAQGV